MGFFLSGFGNSHSAGSLANTEIGNEAEGAVMCTKHVPCRLGHTSSAWLAERRTCRVQRRRLEVIDAVKNIEKHKRTLRSTKVDRILLKHNSTDPGTTGQSTCIQCI